MCKFYQGVEEKAFETRLRAMFAKVHREKPESSRSVCLTYSVIASRVADNTLTGVKGSLLCRAASKR